MVSEPPSCWPVRACSVFHKGLLLLLEDESDTVEDGEADIKNLPIDANDGQDALLSTDASSEHKKEKGFDPYDADNKDLQFNDGDFPPQRGEEEEGCDPTNENAEGSVPFQKTGTDPAKESQGWDPPDEKQGSAPAKNGGPIPGEDQGGALLLDSDASADEGAYDAHAAAHKSERDLLLEAKGFAPAAEGNLDPAHAGDLDPAEDNGDDSCVDTAEDDFAADAAADASDTDDDDGAESDADFDEDAAPEYDAESATYDDDAVADGDMQLIHATSVAAVATDESDKGVQPHYDEEDANATIVDECEVNQPRIYAEIDISVILSPTNGYYGEFFPSFSANSRVAVGHVLRDGANWTSYLIMPLQTHLLQPVHDCLAFDDAIHHASFWVDPKVKKKPSLFLCITISMPFHLGEYGHDGWVPYPHHEPYCPRTPNTSKQPRPRHFPHLPKPFAILFTLLRGSDGGQAREKFFHAVRTMKPKDRIKTKTELQIFSLTKCLLDPGI